MNGSGAAARWSERFGLARSPMFATEVDDSGEHDVLLDGGHGSFGLSVVDDLQDPIASAGWAWSSDLPHHVSVANDKVQVVRWDAAHEPQIYSAASVQRDLDGFYRYLCQDRLRSNRTVVQHLVNLFGRVRTLVAHARLPDERAIDAFITILADLIATDEQDQDASQFGIPEDASELRKALSQVSLSEALRDIRNAPGALSALALHPNLAIRHAGGQLFQEAHFDLVRAPPPDLFGFVEAASSDRVTRGGTHFTPPALARSIVDCTLAQIDGLSSREALTLTDPACGSAAFLHEALRGLRRSGFNGELKIVGRDVSAPAIAMARFTLGLAVRDWQPRGGVSLDLAVGDSLAEAFPDADVTVMNPPFISVIAQTAEQKRQLREIVGEEAGSRGDYSMAFVSNALRALRTGGALGTLFPANLLTHEAARAWRDHLAADGDVRLLARIGDFGLFSQALVHVACLVVGKGLPGSGEFTALVTGNEPGTTGDALRELRKTRGRPPARAIEDKQWSLFSQETDVLRKNFPWRILTPAQRSVIDALEAAQTPTVGDLFEISQGVQTGNLKVFLFNDEQFARLRLPHKEQAYFRDAIMTDSIEKGRLVKIYHLFFPHGKDGPIFSNEDELKKAVPHYYRAVLKPHEAALKQRVTIVRSNRQDWWGLNWHRTSSFALDDGPRIISKFFGAEGSFVLDENARYLPSTGHAWVPKVRVAANSILDQDEEDDARVAADLEVLRAYVALLNSGVFNRLVSYRSVTIAGGQFDLSSRFLNPVHIPDLWEMARSPLYTDYVRVLADHARAVDEGKPLSSPDVERAVAYLYGVPQLGEG